ncbi:adenine phosphoribosyltransferase [Candidatus Peregrinibacteria bacterium]|nr:adenine phosphoribosyltransferase [Candidatus Peregrinibacteria bacterium]
MDLKSHIARVPDFPHKGVTFWDVSTLLQNADALAYTISALADHYRSQAIDKIIAPESRGFLIGGAIAKELHAGFVLARKPGKLPRKTIREEYALEYGIAALEVHADSIQPGEHVLLFDDVLATGGTANACARLVERQGGEIDDMCFLMDLQYLPKTADLSRFNIFSLLQYTEKDLRHPFDTKPSLFTEIAK